MVTTIRVPIDLRNPRTQSLAGNSYFNVVALTNQDLGYWNFVKDVVGKVYGVAEIPNNVNAAPNAKLILTIGANATTGVTTWGCGYAIVNNDGASVNVSFTNPSDQDITVPATARLSKEVSFTLSTGTFTAKYLLFFEITHNGTATNDTLAVDTELYNAQLEIDVN